MSGCQGWPDLNHSAVAQSTFAKSGCAPNMPGKAPWHMSANFIVGGSGTANGAHSILWSSQPMNSSGAGNLSTESFGANS